MKVNPVVALHQPALHLRHQTPLVELQAPASVRVLSAAAYDYQCLLMVMNPSLVSLAESSAGLQGYATLAAQRVTEAANLRHHILLVPQEQQLLR